MKRRISINQEPSSEPCSSGPSTTCPCIQEKTSHSSYLTLHCLTASNDFQGFPWWLSDKESACLAADTGLIPMLGRTPGEGNGNPLQYSCLGNSMDRGAWRATVHDDAK